MASSADRLFPNLGRAARDRFVARTRCRGVKARVFSDGGSACNGIFWSLHFPLLLMLAAHFIVQLRGGEFPTHWPAANWMAPAGALGSLLSGSIGEEIGWRGFAQPLLQKRVGPLTAAIVLGVIWAIWHLNAELTTSQPLAAFLNDAPRSLLRMIATAILYAWLYVRTGGSLPVVMLAHAGHNIAVEVLSFSGAPEGGGFPLTVISSLYALVALPAAWSLWRDGKRIRNPAK